MSIRSFRASLARVNRLPALRFFTDIVGEIAPGSTGKRVPVVAGTMDAWSGLFGAGVRRAGQGVYISGTSAILAIASARRIGAPGIVTFPTAAGLTINAGPTQSGGNSLQWWGGVIGRDVGVLTLASEANRNGRPILFLPHLEGERAPCGTRNCVGRLSASTDARADRTMRWRSRRAWRYRPGCCSTPATRRRAKRRRACFTPAAERAPISGRRSKPTVSDGRWIGSLVSTSAAWAPRSWRRLKSGLTHHLPRRSRP